MTTPRPLFGTGLARSGGHLYNSLLSVNREVMVVNCPYLELYRSFRNAIVRQRADDRIRASFDYSAPFQDNYFTEDGIRVLDTIQGADLANIAFDEDDLDGFAERAGARAALENEDLPPYFTRLGGKTYKDVFDAGLGILVEARDAGNRAWVGFHEPWTVEFYPLLARAYPDAKFIIMFRDPRAMMNSVFGVARIDPTQVVHVLSNIRHWRRMAAFALRFAQDPLFAGRLFISCHEDVLREPEDTVRRMCAFLGVDFDPRMLDTENYVYFATGRTWQGNSSFEEHTSGIKRDRASRWRGMLDPKAVQAIEFLCGAEMEALGYRPRSDHGSPDLGAVSDYIIRERDGYSNWRTDFQDSQRDLGFELFRRALLEVPEDTPLDEGTIRRSFLFEETYRGLREGSRAEFLKTAHQE